jgi:hypothetical protein
MKEQEIKVKELLLRTMKEGTLPRIRLKSDMGFAVNLRCLTGAVNMVNCIILKLELQSGK